VAAVALQARTVAALRKKNGADRMKKSPELE
jgi:hypothetical protein